MTPPERPDDARPEDAPPDDAETMLILGSSHDSVTDFDTLLDTVPDEQDPPPDDPAEGG